MIVWLASFPRSGNTFLRTILNSAFAQQTYSVHGDAADIAGSEEFMKLVGHQGGELRPPQIAKLRETDTCYFIKTHHLPNHYMTRRDKVLYVVRDGRSALISYFHYIRSFGFGQSKSLKDVIVGDTGFGNWSRHALIWRNAPFYHMDIIRYEDLVADTDYNVDRLGSFLELPVLSRDIPTFQAMKSVNKNFFRSGKQRSWHDEMSISDQALFWIFNGMGMMEYGYTDEVPDFIKPLLDNENTPFEYLRDMVSTKNRDLIAYDASRKKILLEKEFATAEISKLQRR